MVNVNARLGAGLDGDPPHDGYRAARQSCRLGAPAGLHPAQPGEFDIRLY